MQIKELIALASIRSGKRQGAMAEEMGHKSKTRISRIGSGELAADASEIVYLAEAAELPPIEILASIESERHPELAQVWEKLIAQYQAETKKLPEGSSLSWRKRRDSNPR